VLVSAPDMPATDDDQERRGRRLLLGKGAVLAHRLARPLAAELDESEQWPRSSDATRSAAPYRAKQQSRAHRRFAWIGAVRPSPLLFTDAGAAWPPTARRRAPPGRPERARRGAVREMTGLHARAKVGRRGVVHLVGVPDSPGASRSQLLFARGATRRVRCAITSRCGRCSGSRCGRPRCRWLLPGGRLVGSAGSSWVRTGVSRP
jgi:hypothetical protein